MLHSISIISLGLREVASGLRKDTVQKQVFTVSVLGDAAGDSTNSHCC